MKNTINYIRYKRYLEPLLEEIKSAWYSGKSVDFTSRIAALPKSKSVELYFKPKLLEVLKYWRGELITRCEAEDKLSQTPSSVSRADDAILVEYQEKIIATGLGDLKATIIATDDKEIISFGKTLFEYKQKLDELTVIRKKYYTSSSWQRDRYGDEFEQMVQTVAQEFKNTYRFPYSRLFKTNCLTWTTCVNSNYYWAKTLEIAVLKNADITKLTSLFNNDDDENNWEQYLRVITQNFFIILNHVFQDDFNKTTELKFRLNKKYIVGLPDNTPDDEDYIDLIISSTYNVNKLSIGSVDFSTDGGALGGNLISVKGVMLLRSFIEQCKYMYEVAQTQFKSQL